MATDETPLNAFWPSGRRVQPGYDAQAFLDEAAKKFGVRPAHIRQAVARNSPAGRMILSMLGLTRQAVVPSGRPFDLNRARLILTVVDELKDLGKSEAEAFALAPRYLADPALRARTNIGRGDAVVLGKGGKLLSAAAVRAANIAHRRDLISKLWFRDPADVPAADPPPI